MRVLVSALALAASIAVAAPASAGNFIFTYSGTNPTNGAFTATGTLTTSNTATTVNGRQAFLITGITGTRNGSAITGLIPAGTDFGGVAIDNYLYATGPYLTDAGFGFSVAGTGNLYNPYYFGGAYQEYVRTAAGADFQNTSGITFTLTAVTGGVPEPATWAMMLIGFGAVGGVLRRRPSVATRIRFA